MNDTFTTMFTERLSELTMGLLFDHMRTNEKISPQIVETMLAEKPDDYQEADEFPYVRWAMHKGELMDREPGRFDVIISGGIWTKGDTAQGTSDIKLLLTSLSRLLDKRSFKPYRLSNRIPYSIGDPRSGNEGLQPHPYHYLTLKLQFLTP